MITTRKRAFISFDFDHDEALRNLLVGQSKNQDSPFNIQDWSLKTHLTGDWITKVRDRIKQTDLTIVICGKYTHRASGVSTELELTKELRQPYFLLQGRANEICKKPAAALSTDKIYHWTWDNLKQLIAGAR